MTLLTSVTELKLVSLFYFVTRILMQDDFKLKPQKNCYEYKTTKCIVKFSLQVWHISLNKVVQSSYTDYLVYIDRRRNLKYIHSSDLGHVDFHTGNCHGAWPE